MVVNCPECNELTPIDPSFSEQRCVVCGETFYDESCDEESELESLLEEEADRELHAIRDGEEY